MTDQTLDHLTNSRIDAAESVDEALNHLVTCWQRYQGCGGAHYQQLVERQHGGNQEPVHHLVPAGGDELRQAMWAAGLYAVGTKWGAVRLADAERERLT